MSSPEGWSLIKLTRDQLSVQEVYESVVSPACGAVSLFVGTTREEQQGGSTVVGLDYEAYEAMVQSEFAKLSEDIRGRWPSVRHLCAHHRLGWVAVGQASVVVAISSPHRHDSHSAIQHFVSQLKAKIPIWKKEVYDSDEQQWKQNVECTWSVNHH
ncbi:molybdopterin synthase catalytic subunit [Neosynchiropus ocellatus]